MFRKLYSSKDNHMLNLISLIILVVFSFSSQVHASAEKQPGSNTNDELNAVNAPATTAHVTTDDELDALDEEGPNDDVLYVAPADFRYNVLNILYIM